MYVRAFGAEFAVTLENQPVFIERRRYQLTFAKYLQTLSTVLARSWLKGQEFPA
jgi:hypothetical protein